MYAICIPAGKVTIRPSGYDATSCELWLDDRRIANYGSAGIAVRAIHSRRTGCADIDSAKVPLPDCVEAWDWISVNPAPEDD